MASKIKNPAAVALGRLGGQKKVTKGFGTLTPEERVEAARSAAKARWGNKARTDKPASSALKPVKKLTKKKPV